MLDENTNDNIPLGFTLLHTLRGHSDWIGRIAWSPDGKILASPSKDHTIRLWDAQTGQHLRTLKGHSGIVSSVAWSPDGKALASGSTDNTIRLWNAQTGRSIRTLEGHSDIVYSVAWSPDGKTLASGSFDQTVHLWDAQAGRSLQTLDGHSSFVLSVAWSPDGKALASGSGDQTIHLWTPDAGQHAGILEGHTSMITCVSFSYDGSLLASNSSDGTVRLWCTRTWEALLTLEEPAADNAFPSLAFHPNTPVLATLGEKDTVIRIWDLDIAALLGTAPASPSFHYTNAKVVLVGDSGVGKSGLGLVLTGQPFVPTESTHARSVWTFDDQEVELDHRRRETRQTLLWDLAGQPGYRLIHQLHLNEVAVALILFDARSETDPFAGVYHWDRALRQAQRVQGNSAPPLKKYLVAARIDRGGRSVSPERIESLVRELDFDSYFETSAREDIGITELAEAIKQTIDWDALPKVTSNDLFQQIKTFLISEKEAGRLLSTTDDLYRTFLKSPDAPSDSGELRAQFETCIGRVESRDLIRRLSFGNLVLLQSELLDSYASALVNAVKDEPDGLGSIAEEKARAGNFSVPRDERLKDQEQEKLLLIAMFEDLLRHEIVLREQADDGPYLVFPSQSTRENPDLPNPEGKAVIFDFEGPVQNIFATLAVRLSHSGFFKKKETWKDAPRVKEIGEKLKEHGILPWLDEWELRPGLSWQQHLEKQIRRIKSVAVFVGKDGIGPWQQKEIEGFLIKFANRNCPVIPVLLPDAPRKPRLPIFLESMTWVDFRIQDPDPMERLIWGITGDREHFS